MILYVDTSALGGAYLGDEADGAWMSELLFGSPDPVITCELTDVEFASVLARARRDGRIDEAALADRREAYEADTADDGPIGVAPLTRDAFRTAQAFVSQTSIRTLDALHLAAARVLAEGGDGDVAIVTRDSRQGAAAAALGFTLHPRSAQ